MCAHIHDIDCVRTTFQADKNVVSVIDFAALPATADDVVLVVGCNAVLHNSNSSRAIVIFWLRMVDAFDNGLAVSDGKNIGGLMVKSVILFASPQFVEVANIFSVFKLAVRCTNFTRFCADSCDITDGCSNGIGVTLTVLCSRGEKPKVYIG